MTADPRRPRLHLTAPTGWVNDPLGLTAVDGTYHLFYQYVPASTQWAAACRWGHATSPDLLAWEHHDVVLAPGDGDDGCWSGSIVVPEGEPAHLFYTSVQEPDIEIGRARVARPGDPDWRTWVKGDVVAEMPADAAAVFRDPYVFRDPEKQGGAGGWRMLVGAGLRDGTATAFVYSSPDLHRWQADGTLAARSARERDPVWTGQAWECPQLFALGDRHVLVVSVWEPGTLHYEACAVGEYADGRFTPQTWQRLSYGPSPYAGSTFVDREGRRGLISWLRGVQDLTAGWAGALSVPRLLDLRDGRVVATPHPALTQRRAEGPVRLPAGGRPAEVPGPVDVEWRPSPGSASALRVQSTDGRGVLDLRVEDGTLQARTAAGTWTMPAGDGALRVLLDGPVAEVFGDAGVLGLPVEGVAQYRLGLDGGGEADAHPLRTEP